MMPREKHVDEAGFFYHAINRGNARQEIFHKPEDYEAFIYREASALGAFLSVALSSVQALRQGRALRKS